MAPRDYGPIGAFLKAQGTPTVTVSVAHLDGLLSGGLPMSAYKWGPFWRGTAVGSPTHSWKRVWEDAGYTVKSYDSASKSVMFRRL